MSRYRTVHGAIFLSFSFLLVSVLTLFSLLVYDYAQGVANERFTDTLTSLSTSVQTNLDARIGEMDRLSLTLVYSRVFQDLYAVHLALPKEPTTTQQRIARLENTEALIEICDTVLGPNQTAPQINVFDPRGEMIGAGYNSRLVERDVTREAWFPALAATRGERVVLLPDRDAQLEQTSVIAKDKRYVSLLRRFQDSMHATGGILEVKQYCDALFGELDRLSATAAVVVVDKQGRVVYPYLTTVDPGELSALVKGGAGPFEVDARSLHRGPLIFVSTTSGDTGWTTFLGEPSAGLSTSIMEYAVRIALIALIAILASLVASYFIARRITVPIQTLHNEIDAVDLKTLVQVEGGPKTRSPGEIEALRLAIHDMRLKLNDSIHEVVTLRAHEREAQLVALQSQLNPHFLHNMLQTVAILAEENDTATIQSLITNLAEVLRYVSATDTTATLGMEVGYARCYLEAMKVRFGGNLDYTIAVQPDLEQTLVPRLLLQPLIENCFKYVTAVRPPWLIELRGEQLEGRWRVEVLDNGPGFSPDTLARLHEKLAAAPVGLPKLAISGLGILSSRERFCLVFGPQAVFTLGNRPDGGAFVAMEAPT